MAAGAMQSQVGAAAGAEAESTLHGVPALGAMHGQGTAQQEEQNNPERVGNEDRQQSPAQTIHTAAACIMIDVSDQQNVTAENDSREEATKNAAPQG